jgi:hypothetical protein
MANLLVEFVDDMYPHCKGDVVEISTDEKKAFDKTIEARGINGYKLIDTTPKEVETKTETKDVKTEAKK